MKMKVKKRFVILMVFVTILLGIALVVVSLSSYRLRLDRETAVAAAKHDGTALLSAIAGMPAGSTGFVEVEIGPLAPDLTNVDEAWIIWRQTYSAESGLSAAVDWHRKRLPEADWILKAETPDKAIFEKGEWTVTLSFLTNSDSRQIHREVKWTRDPAVL